jgi:cytidyltransferase-like protein
MVLKSKVKRLEDLASVLEKLRGENKRIVHCHGCFDLLHIGHIRHFRQAKQHGDILIVTVTPDRYVDKGPDHPAFNENLRIEALASLGIIDYVAINEWPTAENTLRLLKPNVYAKGSEFQKKGSDFTGKIDKEKEAVNEIGAEMVFTDDIVFSSSSLINRFFSNKPAELHEYLRLFRERNGAKSVDQVLDSISKLKVMVIGDTIIDDYHYCNPLGKSNKDPLIAMHYLSNDMFAGGVLAVANHVANFAKKVHLFTVLGDKDSYCDFIKNKLCSNVALNYITKPNSPTLIKRRFLDSNSLNKLFEVYVMDDRELPSEIDAKFCEKVKNCLKEVDLVIVADYGHGAISENMVKLLCDSAPFLAVNTQANAGNRGFHIISRYPKADYACLAEHELRLEARIMNGSIRPIMDDVATRHQCKYLAVTLGRKGSLIRAENGDFVASPSLASDVIDRIGAGDAFFALTAMSAYQGIKEEVLSFVGNVAASMAVGIIGNQKSIEKQGFQSYYRTLLK